MTKIRHMGVWVPATIAVLAWVAAFFAVYAPYHYLPNLVGVTHVESIFWSFAAALGLYGVAMAAISVHSWRHPEK